MPIDTQIAGAPDQIIALGTSLSSTLHHALTDQRYSLAGPRNAYRDIWQGPAGEQVADATSDLIDDADHLLDAFRTVGDAVTRFGERLHDIHASMRGYLAAARARGLTVNGSLIEDVAPLMPMAYSSDGPIPASVTAAYDAHRARVDAFNEIAASVDSTVSSYVDACQTLTDTIGDVVDGGWLADLVLAGAPGSLSFLGDDVLGPLSRRVGRSRAISDLLQGLNGDAMGDMMRHLFASVNGLSDRSVLAGLADLSNKSGGALDRYLVVAGILSGLEDGESLQQAVVSEGGGWLAGTAATAGTYAGAGALFGSSVGPLGTVAIGGAALVTGIGVGLFTSSTIDGWYEDAEFEQLIQDGLAEQQSR